MGPALPLCKRTQLMPEVCVPVLSAYSSECTTEYEVMCTSAQATSVSRSMAWRRFLSR
jgi:hypothetical protein